MTQTQSQAKYYQRNRERLLIKQKTYRESHRQQYAGYSKTYRTKYPDRKYLSHIKHTFGLTKEEIEIMYSAQNGQCVICGYYFKSQAEVHIDHSHESGEIRGLLCSKCNHAIGLLQDDCNICLSAAKYLAIHGS